MDFEDLERIAELSDQVELDACRLDLMQNSTQRKAAEMYESAISKLLVVTLSSEQETAPLTKPDRILDLLEKGRAT